MRKVLVIILSKKNVESVKCMRDFHTFHQKCTYINKNNNNLTETNEIKIL